MDYKAKIAEAQAKMDRLKAKIGAAADGAKTAREMKKEEIAANIAALDRELDELDAAIDSAITQNIADTEAAMDLIEEAFDQQMEEDIATAKGHVAAAKENARLARERRESRLNSLKLRAQMNVNAAKAKVAEKKEERDKSKQEQRIADLLMYADKCGEMSYAFALETEMTILEAAAEAADYIEKYGE